MIQIKNNIIPAKGYKIFNFFSILFVRKDAEVTDVDINHERIHNEQMKELLFLPFYIHYGLEWLIKLFIHKFKAHTAYRNVSFEKEAYANESNLDYISHRKHYNWIKSIFK